MAKNYFDRYVWLISTIARHEYIRFSDINDAWTRSSINEKHENLSQRTFFNHIDAILMVFGIEIKCDRSRGYYIANNEYIESDGMRQWLLESLSLNNLLNEAKDMKGRVLFEKIPSSRNWLSVIVDAMRDEQAVEMTYQGFTRPEPHTFIAHPWCVKLFKRRWYMLARSEDYKEPRIYALDRIHEIYPVDKKLKVPHTFNATKFFAEYFGVTVTPGCKVETVDVRHDATVGSGYHYMVADANGDCAVVEFDKEDGWKTMIVRKAEGENFMLVTNHLLSEKYYTTEPDPAVGNPHSKSWWRYETAMAYLQEHNGILTKEQAQECLALVHWKDLVWDNGMVEDTQYSNVYDQTEITLDLRNWNDYDKTVRFNL